MSELRRALVAVALAGCSSGLRAVPPVPPVAACGVATIGLAAPSVGGLRPSVAAGNGRIAVAWLELGGASAADHEAIRVALFAVAGGATLVAPPVEVAPGWRALSSPRLAATDGGFLVAFGGRDPAGREGIALATVRADGQASAPSVTIDAGGGPSALAVARIGARVVVAWSSWEVDSPTVNVSIDGAPPQILDPAPRVPSLRLVPEGAALRAVWSAARPGGDVVRGAILDGEHPLERLFDAGTGRDPSLVPLAADELLLAERDGTLRLVRVAPDGAVAPLAAPFGHTGVLAPTAGGALLCAAGASDRGDGDDINCTRMRGALAADTIAVATGAWGVQALGAATVDGTTALAWQQDGADGQGMVAVALIRCRGD